LRPADLDDRRGASPSNLRARRAAPRTKRTILFKILAGGVECSRQPDSSVRPKDSPSSLKFESSRAFPIQRWKSAPARLSSGDH